MKGAGVRLGAIVAAMLALAGCVAPAARRPAVPEPAEEKPTPADTPALRLPLAALIAGAPELSRFRALATAGGLATLIAERGPVTVLAPTDAAFARLAPGTVEALVLPGNRPSLLHLLRFWVVPGSAAAAILAQPAAGSPARLPTLDGEAVLVLPMPGGVALADAAGRRSSASVRPSSDGTLVLLDGVIGPRSIEPGGAVPGS